jgi:crotonobetainyl-CoA:carnitine CoA-transferase CaiB-like acyl-CoA transferase
MTMFRDLKVLELGRVFSAPLCGMVLADLGAQVLKIEKPGTGDEARSFGHTRAGGSSSYFDSLNRNKTSLALDLTAPRDRDELVRLIRESDVLVHNWLQPSLDKRGFSYEAVKILNPALIYCGISGYGHGSPFHHLPAQDIVAQALSGLMSLTGEPDGPPLKSGIPVVDYVTGLYAAFSIMAALYMRQRTGEGQLVTVSLLESALAMTSFESAAHLSLGVSPARHGNRHPAICPYNDYRTRDGLVVIAVANDEMWKRFCHALRLDPLLEDERFQTNAKRLASQDELEAILQTTILRFQTQELVNLMEREKISCTKVNTIPEAFASEPVKHLDMVVRCGEQGATSFVGKAFHLEKVPDVPVTAPPALGNGNPQPVRTLDRRKQKLAKAEPESS